MKGEIGGPPDTPVSYKFFWARFSGLPVFDEQSPFTVTTSRSVAIFNSPSNVLTCYYSPRFVTSPKSCFANCDKASFKVAESFREFLIVKVRMCKKILKIFCYGIRSKFGQTIVY